MEEEGEIFEVLPRIFFFDFAPGLSYNLSKLSDNFTPFFQLWKTIIKARGWWPGTWSSSKIFFWQFVFPWVDLALLKPMKNFPWEKCAIQATKNKAKSCSFFDAIRCCSCGRSADWLKIDGRENPVDAGTLETGRCGARCALPLQAPLTCTSSLSCPSSDRWESHWKRNLRQR